MEPISASIAGLFALVGVAVILAGLFADRSRGRRRCAACGYVMDGLESREVGRTCPECGKVSKSERAMRRTRRRPGIVAAGLGVLLLAAGVAGWSRWDAVGVLAIPDAVLARLWALDDADIRNETLRRIDNGRFNTGELRILMARVMEDLDDPALSLGQIASAQKAIDRMVFWVASRPQDAERESHEPARRLIAETLGPLFADRLLNDPDPAERRNAFQPCSILASRSVVAQHALLAAAADPDPSVAGAQQHYVSRGLWMMNGLMPHEVETQAGAGRMMWLGERIGPWIRERPATAETIETLAWHLIDPALPDAGYLQGDGEAGVGAALLLCVNGPTEEMFGVVAPLADADARGPVAITPIRLLAAFGWRDEIRPLLLAAIAHRDWEVRDAGWDVLTHFAPECEPFPEDLLAVIRRPEADAERRAPEIVIAMGVPQPMLRDAALSVVRAQLEAWRRNAGEPFRIEDRDVIIGGGVVDWIASVAEPGDEEVAAVLRELTVETEPGLGCRVARAFLDASGDGERVTRFVLDAYARSNAGEFENDRRTTARIGGAMRWLLFDTRLDVDGTLAWIGSDPLRGRRIAELFGASIRGPLLKETRANIERLMTALLEDEIARDAAERVLDRIPDESAGDAD
jgi:predicted RNA-binding Zn-ribbon protein involved in translation (DUF1610 family)